MAIGGVFCGNFAVLTNAEARRKSPPTACARDRNCGHGSRVYDGGIRLPADRGKIFSKIVVRVRILNPVAGGKARFRSPLVV